MLRLLGIKSGRNANRKLYAEMVEWSIAAVLKTSFVFLCNFLKTLDFIGFFGGRLAFCEKPFSQFSRNFLT